MTVYVDPELRDDALRQTLYAGNLIVLTRLHAVTELVEYTRNELAELFSPHDPEHAHEFIDPTEMAKILGVWKPRFIHDDRSKKLVCDIVDRGWASCRVHTYYDVPKPRTSFPTGPLDHWRRVCIPVAPRCVVQRAGPAAELVDAHLRG